jgi:RecA-family ATPase
MEKKKNRILPETLYGDNLVQEIKDLNDKTEWLAEGFMTEPSITMIYGTDGLGKSFLGIQNAAEFASGLPLFHAFPVSEPKRIIYCPAERSIKEPLKRLRDMISTDYMKDSFKPQNLCITTSFQGRDISNKAVSDLLISKLVNMSETIGGADCVYFDPLYALVKGDLKSDEAINGVFDFFRRVGNELGASVVFIHHENRGQRVDGEKERSGQDYYGNKFISGLCTSIYHMKREDKKNEMRTVLVNEKDTDRVLAPRIELEYHPELATIKADMTSSPIIKELNLKEYLNTKFNSGQTFSSEELFKSLGLSVHPVNKRKMMSGWIKEGRLKNIAPAGSKGIYSATGTF